MINLGEEFVKRNQEQGQKLSEYTLEYYRLSEHKRSIAKRIKELDLLIVDLTSAIQINNKAAKQFDAYLAVKEGAVTLDEIENGVKLAAKKEK